ncbi:MAG: hypothetical protein Q8K70_00225 [Bacteroidota bacterium]|nr:hypothetical protein [Bacteroidota bacterium]
MSQSTNLLKSKIEEFIRKYYLNVLLRGVLLALATLISFFIITALLEYFGQFNSRVRTFLFFSFIATAIYILGKFIVLPLLKWLKIGKTLSHKEASKIIGVYFPEISDKLLNTLQLEEQSQNSNNELLIASIEQRSKTLSPIKFSSAINIKASVIKYGKYAAVPVLLFLLLIIFQSNVITKSTQRLVAFNQEFEKEAPFQFVLKNESLTVQKNSSFSIDVETEGKDLPSDVYVVLNDQSIKMEKSSKKAFNYSIPNILQSQTFYFTDGVFKSKNYQIEVLPNPSLLNFRVQLNYPSYIGKTNEVLKNTGDFTVPQGTVAEWTFYTKDAEDLSFIINDKALKVEQNKDVYVVKCLLKNAANYQIVPFNKAALKKDSIRYQIQILEDRHPGIYVEQLQDSINPFVYYFFGKADDDYGLSKLMFSYKVNGQNQSKLIPVNIGRSADEMFYYRIDFRSLQQKDGEDYEYYFEVWDNDAVNGHKSTKSQIFSINTPDREELRAETESSNQSIKNKLKETLKEVTEIQKKSQEMSKQLMESDNMDWQKEKKLKEFFQEQKNLQNKIEELQKENQLKNEKEKQLSEEEKEILEKQKEIEKLFNELLSPEMKDLMKKMEELLKQQKKEELQKQMENMNLKNEDLKKQLDRTLEQFKQLELEKKIKDQVNELQKLAEEQKALSEKTQEKNANQEDIKKQQEDINQKFDKIKEELKNIENKNKELETPLKMEETQKEQESIEKDLNESSDQLGKKQNKKASQKQKEASEKMEELAEKMKKSLEEAQEQQEEEDYYTLRQILENLIELSFQQEDLMQQLKGIRNYNPKYVELSEKQRKLKADAKIIEDSLLALSKRQIQIKSYVNKELSNINYQMDKTIQYLAKIEMNPASASQQYVMTGMNNLAVMLSESLKKMQDEMNEKKSKKQKPGQCNNPGKKPGKPGDKPGNKPSMKGMKDMQDALNKQLKEMQNGKQQGKSPNSEQFAKIAAQQEALRRELGRLEKLLKEDGKPGSLGDLEKTKQLMEQQEKDLVNKRISPETIRRMEDIQTRLLEHEKAEREQEQDNQREAEQAKPIENRIPPSIKEYLEKKAKEIELLRKAPNEFSPYYKERVRIYFNQLGNN